MTDNRAMDDELLESALASAFPEREVASIEPAGISWNDQNETVRVNFTDEETAYLKIAVDGKDSRIITEDAVIKYLNANCDVAVPTVLASQPRADPPYLVTAPMRGQNLAEGWDDRSLDDRLQIIRQLGTALAEIHSCSFGSHGHIVGGDAGDLRIDTGTWTEILVEIVEFTQERASSDRFEHHFSEVKAALRANQDLLDGAPASLTYGDPAQPNLFLTGESIGFIDWEIAHIGDPVRELNRVKNQFIWYDTDQMVSALHEGYRERAGSLPTALEERIPVYDVIWHLNQSAVFDKHAASADDIEEAAQSHEEEMNRLLDAIR